MAVVTGWTPCFFFITIGQFYIGEMAEWLKAHAWKACLGETLTWVRIPLSPPSNLSSPEKKSRKTPGIMRLFWFIVCRCSHTTVFVDDSRWGCVSGTAIAEGIMAGDENVSFEDTLDGFDVDGLTPNWAFRNTITVVGGCPPYNRTRSPPHGHCWDPLIAGCWHWMETAF